VPNRPQIKNNFFTNPIFLFSKTGFSLCAEIAFIEEVGNPKLVTDSSIVNVEVIKPKNPIPEGPNRIAITFDRMS